MARLLFTERCAASKVGAHLKSSNECVGNPAGPARTDDVLQVGLEEDRVSAESEAVGQLQRDLVPLHSDGRIRQLRTPLRVLQVIAEATVRDAEAPDVRRT